jgi:ribosomal protein S18 acetylase RimI-like enzyme
MNKNEIRRLLLTNKPWSLYPLADLDDDLFPHCEWFALPNALAMVFKSIAIRPIFVLGNAEDTRKLLQAMPEPAGYLNLLPHQLPAAEGIYQYQTRQEMQRMLLEELRPRSGETVPLSIEHAGEILNLYATGTGGGIAFAPFQLNTTFFRGIRRNGELIAVAGVQVASRSEGVAAIGNIYTHPEHRNRGLAQTVTSAVAQALIEANIPTIGLNVERTNAPAIAAYHSLGFRQHLTYTEGVAHKLSGPADYRLPRN